MGWFGNQRNGISTIPCGFDYIRVGSGKNIDTNFIYKEIVGWNDETTELRYCIAVSRMEYLNATSEKKQEILLSDHIYYLYRLVAVKKSFKDLICLLWYLWCEEDGKYLTAHVEDMNRFIGFFHRRQKFQILGTLQIVFIC